MRGKTKIEVERRECRVFSGGNKTRLVLSETRWVPDLFVCSNPGFTNKSLSVLSYLPKAVLELPNAWRLVMLYLQDESVLSPPLKRKYIS